MPPSDLLKRRSSRVWAFETSELKTVRSVGSTLSEGRLGGIQDEGLPTSPTSQGSFRGDVGVSTPQSAGRGSEGGGASYLSPPTPQSKSPSRRMSSVEKQERRSSVWDMVLSPKTLSPGGEEDVAGGMLPIPSMQRQLSVNLSSSAVNEDEEEADFGAGDFGDAGGGYGSDSSSGGSSMSSAISERLIAEHFDVAEGGAGSFEVVQSEGVGALGALGEMFSRQRDGPGGGGGGDDDDATAVPPRVLHRWRWFVLCTVHLRFADCAEQQEEPFHAAGLFPMATGLALAEDAAHGASGGSNEGGGGGGGGDGGGDDGGDDEAGRRAPQVGDLPTRRATLFGSVVGVYRAAIQEGVVTMTHCLGDHVSDISQALRVRKSQTMHRVQRPPLYVDLLPGREGEPRKLPTQVRRG